MQITISRKILADALAALALLAGKNNLLTIFNNIKFVTKGNKIRLQTSDGTTTIRKYVEAENIDQDGEMVVDCATLNAFVSKCKCDMLDLILNGNTLTVIHEKGEAVLPTFPAEDFVEPRQDDDYSEVTISAGLLADMITLAKNFVGVDVLRPQMRPIRAIVEDGMFTVCATDTHKLFTDAYKLNDTEAKSQWFIEPPVFSLLAKACKKQESVNIRVSPTNVLYRIGTTTIFSQQTQGNYPNFKRVIPHSHVIDVVCQKDDLIGAMQRVQLFSEESKLAKVKVSALSMDIQADNIEKLQKSVETFSCTSNEEITFGVNSQIFIDCVNACSSEEVTIELNDASRPIVFKDSSNPDRTVLCMPMSLVNN